MSHAKVLYGLLVVGIAIPVAAQAAHERRSTLRVDRDMAAFANLVEPMNSMNSVAGASSEQRVELNGAPLYFRKSTERGTLDEVLARVAKECASGTESAAFGLSKNLDDGVSKPITLQRVVTQEAENGARASLCIFANEENAGPERLRRVRYTLAHRRDDGTISLATVVNASSTPLNEIFPLEGDAPGSDLADIARPEQSRRTMTAIIPSNHHAVRVYETPLAVQAAVTSYDKQMSGLGYVTTGTLDDARMYRKDGRSYVASFRGTTGGSTVALLPFGSIASR